MMIVIRGDKVILVLVMVALIGALSGLGSAMLVIDQGALYSDEDVQAISVAEAYLIGVAEGMCQERYKNSTEYQAEYEQCMVDTVGQYFPDDSEGS